MEREKILAVAGTDARAASMKRCFEKAGYRTLGIDEAALAHLCVLPMPYTADSEHIKDTDITIEELFSSLGTRCPALGGRLDRNAYGVALRHGVRLFDYYENESAQIENAALTAEAAIALAAQMGVSLLGKKVIVLGYGRISKILCRLLKSAGARVYAAARREEDLAWIKVSGYTPLDINLLDNLPQTRLVYNTVPAKILSSDTLRSLGRGALIIELASQPCCDDGEASEYGVEYVRASALPGKYYPDAAGEILARSAMRIIEREELII